MSYPVALLAFGVLAMGMTGFTMADDYKEVWSDDFNGPNDSALDSKKWSLNEGNVNQDLDYTTKGTNNAALDGQGHLVVSAKKTTPEEAKKLHCSKGPCQYTAASLASNFDFKYGKVDVGVALPEGGKGVWVGIGILSDEKEAKNINILNWDGSTPKEIQSAIFGENYSKDGSIFVTYKSQDSLSSKFHKLTLEWEENSVVWSIDGKTYGKKTPQDLPKGAQWYFNDRKFYVVIVMGVGKNPDKNTKFPQTMKVDYVKISQKKK